MSIIVWRKYLMVLASWGMHITGTGAIHRPGVLPRIYAVWRCLWMLAAAVRHIPEKFLFRLIRG